MYRPKGKSLQEIEAELHAFGASIEDYATDELNEKFGFGDVDVWPENWPSYLVFSAMQTQWRMGFNGPTGLDYTALSEVWRRLKVPVQERDVIFADVQIMELAALEQISINQAAK